MRLWIDGQCLQTTSRLRGIGRYALELIRAIGETCPEVEMSISFNAAMSDTAVAARDAGRPLDRRRQYPCLAGRGRRMRNPAPAMSASRS